MYVYCMSVRKTIRITQEMEERIKNLVGSGGYITQMEVIRIALNKGLNELEKKC